MNEIYKEKINELERKSKRQMSIAIASLIGFIITIMISFFVL